MRTSSEIKSPRPVLRFADFLLTRFDVCSSQGRARPPLTTALQNVRPLLVRRCAHQRARGSTGGAQEREQAGHFDQQRGPFQVFQLAQRGPGAPKMRSTSPISMAKSKR